MKKKSVSKAAFFNPRALIGFGFGAIGFFLAVVAFITFPSTSALAVPGTCATVTFEDVPGEDYNELYVTMTSQFRYLFIAAWRALPATSVLQSACIQGACLPNGGFGDYVTLCLQR
jgi:hypothetical protein